MDSDSAPRSIPNIVITGTPGTGKTTHAELLMATCPITLRHLSVGDLIKEKKLYEDYDSEWESYIVDDDKAGSFRLLKGGFRR